MKNIIKWIHEWNDVNIQQKPDLQLVQSSLLWYSRGVELSWATPLKSVLFQNNNQIQSQTHVYISVNSFLIQNQTSRFRKNNARMRKGSDGIAHEFIRSLQDQASAEPSRNQSNKSSLEREFVNIKNLS